MRIGYCTWGMMKEPIEKVLVLGGGSAGLLAALAVKKTC